MKPLYLDRVSNKALGELLIEKSLLTEKQLHEGLEHARKTSTRLGEALRSLGYVSSEALVYTMAEQFGLKPLELEPEMVDAELVRRFPLALLRRHSLLPLVQDEENLVIVAADPNDTEGLKAIQFLAASYQISVQLGDEAQIQRCLARPDITHNAATKPTAELGVGDTFESDTTPPPPDIVRWIMTVAIQNPDCDTYVRAANDDAVVFYGASITEPQRQVHDFRAAFYPALREVLVATCRSLSPIAPSAYVWPHALRFMGQEFTLLLTETRDLAGSTLRLRPLLHRLPFGTVGTAAASGIIDSDSAVTVVAYTDAQQAETVVAELVGLLCAESSALVFDSQMRNVYRGAVVYPLESSDLAAAVAVHGAEYVIFDRVPDASHLAQVFQALATPPRVIVFHSDAAGQFPVPARHLTLAPDSDAVHEVSPESPTMTDRAGEV
jgi:hypothetical protein